MSAPAIPLLHADETATDEALVRRLLARQFPQWADRAVRPVASSGTDNAMYRLGDDLAMRLPRTVRSADKVAKEQHWLPRLAPLLPLTIAEPVALGEPDAGFPWAWSVYRWIEGAPISLEALADPTADARTLARFIRALHQVDVAGGPPPGAHNNLRGQPIRVRDALTRRRIGELAGEIDAEAATAAWEETMAAGPWRGPDVWVHGDLMPGNLLARDGVLAAVIDFGCLGVGDPACELMPAWNLFAGDSRRAFRDALAIDDDAWARGRGWALHSGLMALPYYRQSSPAIAAMGRRTIDAVLHDAETGA